MIYHTFTGTKLLYMKKIVEVNTSIYVRHFRLVKFKINDYVSSLLPSNKLLETK
jgi:hypothetical protein